MSEEIEKIGIDDITERLAETAGENEETAKEFIHTLFETIGEELLTGDRVPIFKFGTFKKTYVDERPGNDPNTGEEITIPAHYRIHFTPSDHLADAVNWKYNYLEAYDIPEDTESAEESIESEPVKETDIMTAPVLAEDDELFIPDETEAEVEVEAEEPAESGETLRHEESEPVEHEEMSALLDPEKNHKKPEKRRGLIAVLSAAVIALLLGAFLLGRYSVQAGTDADVPAEIAATGENKEASPGETEKGPAETDNGQAAESGDTAESAVTEKPAESGDTTDDGPVQNRRVEEIHTVSYGDTFVSLAEGYWGDKYLWPILYLDNQSAFPNPNFLEPGQKIDIYTAPVSLENLSDKEIDYILNAYVEMYHVYRDFGDEMIRRGKEQNTSYFQNLGFWRHMEARTLIFTATKYDADFLEKVKSELEGNDYEILRKYIDYHGTFDGF